MADPYEEFLAWVKEAEDHSGGFSEMFVHPDMLSPMGLHEGENIIGGTVIYAARCTITYDASIEEGVVLWKNQ